MYFDEVIVLVCWFMPAVYFCRFVNVCTFDLQTILPLI